MKERPILFSAPMVRALLNCTKSQTRRIVKPSHIKFFGPSMNAALERSPTLATAFCPYGQPGDRLWVRETWQYYDWTEEGEPCIRFHADNATTWPEPGNDAWSDKLVDVWEILSRDENYNIDNRARDRRWRPSIHMPRWASRILLEVTSVRVERLQDISEADAEAEGPPKHFNSWRDNFCALWQKINGDGSWDANPWVWVVEFQRAEGGA